MASIDSVIKLAGTWTGTNRLWMMPGDPVRESASTATVTPVAKGGFARIDYTWSFEGKPHEGSLLVGIDKAKGRAIAVFCDSWHMSETFMVCEGDEVGGTISVTGSYAAPPGPDWGWRTVIEPADDAFRLAMYNIEPDGEEALAVETVFSRQP
jgi:hypothetical protein